MKKLSARSSLEHPRKEAKRWLKAIVANDDSARSRFTRAYPNAPASPASATPSSHGSWNARAPIGA